MTGEPGAGVRRALEEVAESLSRPQRELSPKYFYDERGSRLFEEITRLPEYYLTRTELELLRGPGRAWLEIHRPATLVELGAGSARKTETLLDLMEERGFGRVYVPVDVSAEFLGETARRVARDYPSLRVEPLVADLTRDLHVGEDLPAPALFALLGSTVGNFPGEAARKLLARIRHEMGPEDLFLMGADLRAGDAKPREVLEAAYNDAQGVTAEFNRNALRVLNRTLGTDFDPEAFEHRAFYDPERGRIEMHLVVREPQTVGLPGHDPLRLRAGESIRTEISAKYDRPAVEDLFRSAGLELEGWAGDEDCLYALALGRSAG